MWVVYEKRHIKKILRRVPKEVLVRYEAWKRIVEQQRIEGIRRVKGFHDEALKGKWKGFRSSRLGNQWRVIYRVIKDHLDVYVFEVNPHNY